MIVVRDEELIIGFFEKSYCCDLDEVKQTCLGLLKENQELKANWNKLREWIEQYEKGSYGLSSYQTGICDGLGDVIKKMQELEQGADSND